jgi:WxL domain surface cell wall-binding
VHDLAEPGQLDVNGAGDSVTDDTGSDNGYSVTVSSTDPTVDGSTAAAGTGASVMLTPPSANAASGNPATTGPVAESAQTLSTTPATIENARAGTGQGEWDFPADSGGAGTGSLVIDIPGNASGGAFSSTLTFTTAPPAG